jgi:hypothetical protein
MDDRPLLHTNHTVQAATTRKRVDHTFTEKFWILWISKMIFAKNGTEP